MDIIYYYINGYYFGCDGWYIDKLMSLQLPKIVVELKIVFSLALLNSNNFVPQNHFRRVSESSDHFVIIRNLNIYYHFFIIRNLNMHYQGLLFDILLFLTIN